MNKNALYYKDPYCREFDAAVLKCEAKGKNWLVVLDNTAFYPEGGGQLPDFGTISDANVSDVQEEDDIIYHTCDMPLEVGRCVHCKIDWPRRFDHMQQHSGEHIISGMICSAFDCDNVGFHMNDKTVTIDYNTSASWEELLEIERKANIYVCENHPLIERWSNATELKDTSYRSKKELPGDIRIVSFPGADTCACCGTHVSSSGQTGMIKLLSMQKFHGGIRLELVCGLRALSFFNMHLNQNTLCAKALSSKPKETSQAVLHLKDEIKKEKERSASLEAFVIEQIAASKKDAGDTLLIRDSMPQDSIRRLCEATAKSCNGLCAVFAGGDKSYHYTIIHHGHDISPLVKDLNSKLNGKGGGRDGFASGNVLCSPDEIRSFFSDIIQF